MRTVVKLGGSLLLRHDLVRAINRWLQANREQSFATQWLFVVGGGSMIDAIRDLDRIRPGDPEEVHWRCVDLLQTTFDIVGNWFDWNRIGSTEELNRANREGFPVERPTLVAVRSFYSPQIQSEASPSLPHDWRTTTDSIAARLAQRVAADELVLLKSCMIDQEQSIEELAQQGIVDEAFPRIARTLDSVRVERLL